MKWRVHARVRFPPHKCLNPAIGPREISAESSNIQYGSWSSHLRRRGGVSQPPPPPPIQRFWTVTTSVTPGQICPTLPAPVTGSKTAPTGSCEAARRRILVRWRTTKQAETRTGPPGSQCSGKATEARHWRSRCFPCFVGQGGSS